MSADPNSQLSVPPETGDLSPDMVAVFNKVEDMIPESVFQRINYLRDVLTSSYWELGDIANAHFARCLANGMDGNETHMVINDVIGRLAGKSGRSIRLYARAAAFYPPEVRKKFEILPFSHYIYAMQYREIAPDDVPEWRKVLDASLSYTDRYGLAPSVSRIKMVMLAQARQGVDSAWEPGIVIPGGQLPGPVMADLPDQPVDPIDAMVQMSQDSWLPPDDAMTPEDGEAANHQILVRINNCLAPVPGLLTMLNEKCPAELSQDISRVQVMLKDILDAMGYYIDQGNGRKEAIDLESSVPPYQAGEHVEEF